MHDKYWEDNGDLHTQNPCSHKIYKQGEDTADKVLFLSKIIIFVRKGYLVITFVLKLEALFNY